MAKTTIEFNEIASNALDQLVRELQIGKADVLRHALSLYAFVVEQSKNGYQLGLVKNGEAKQLIIVPGIMRASDERPFQTASR